MGASPDHIVIAGPMGVGKTTVASIVAGALGWTLLDSDTVIATQYGRDAAEIAAREGVERLHQVEAEVLREALGSAGPSVIAPAASIADDAALLGELRDRTVFLVVLDCEPEILAKRAAGAAHRRPVSRQAAIDLASKRGDALDPVADLHVDVTRLAANDVALRIIAAVEERSVEP